MNEIHPSVSAIGSHLDEKIEITALARQYYEEEGCPEGRAEEHWLRAERALNAGQALRGRIEMPLAEDAPMTEDGIRTEESMHLDQ